ncbi:thioesterase family protein [Paenibacillus sp. Marseille-Q4541]|uniref:acyl-CoA thioesterase n=1 Tax=Paenibacillus sp. Marseille-Q4541 TaxID=2831522 RepID=UPI001BAA1C0F|nr:thioesterase family protein [Paenibacillus sp. Marseille-Q4541]
MKTELKLIVRSTEIDVNGHVNNAKYLEYLEWGREEWYEAGGLSYNKLLQEGYQTVTVNININYRKECLQNDWLTVITEPAKAGNSSYVLKQTIMNEEGVVCADAAITSVTMDTSTRKSKPIPQLLRNLFEKS